MPAKALQIRDALYATVDGVSSVDVTFKGFRSLNILEGSKVNAMVLWGVESGEPLELQRRERVADYAVRLATKAGSMEASDDQLAQVAADLTDALEVQSSGAYLGLVSSPTLVKSVSIIRIDPVEIPPEQNRDGWVIWDVFVRIVWRYTRGSSSG